MIKAPKIPSMAELTIKKFIDTFHEILEWKKKLGRRAYYDNPDRETLRAQAQFYGEPYANGSIGWTSNIWSRSEKSSVSVEDDSQLEYEHKLLMRSALEYVLAPNPLIKVDGILGQNERVRFHCRVWVDARYPDLPLRWRELTFPADPNAKPNMEMLVLPGLWTPATVPGSDGKVPLFIIRFPEHWFSLITVSSYQGEIKKGCLSHWIYYVYLKGGTGIHAGSRVFEVLDKNNKWKKVGMIIFGLTGSGKSTHSMYVFDETNAKFYQDRGIDVLKIVRNQYVKNDDIIALFDDCALGSERCTWTKTEDVTPKQILIYKAGMSPRAMHENTGMDINGNPDFLDTTLQYRGRVNQNARTVMYFEDMKPYFDGSVDIDFPPNMVVFISPGYLTDYAWVKINDANFAALVLAAGRTVGHPAQGAEGICEEKFCPLYNPFIIGKRARKADHVHRFRDIKVRRDLLAKKTGQDTLECYLINTTGRVGTEYEIKDGHAYPIFKEVNGKRVPVGGTGPSIEETELFLLQAARGLVKYKPHPIWGEKVLVPVEVPGIPKERLKELDPFTYRTMDEMKTLLRIQIRKMKEVLDKEVKGLDPEI
ncbi:MAG TPA: phosphoenolpyruvate carboxykinase (ATP), partial [Candidatus Altiarchaeales archaeon]|nr:phosphoenolpyruvate carboxykinase (ATP) [Candidatus Altiarchaeales archaeon]